MTPSKNVITANDHYSYMVQKHRIIHTYALHIRILLYYTYVHICNLFGLRPRQVVKVTGRGQMLDWPTSSLASADDGHLGSMSILREMGGGGS